MRTGQPADIFCARVLESFLFGRLAHAHAVPAIKVRLYIQVKSLKDIFPIWIIPLYSDASMPRIRYRPPLVRGGSRGSTERHVHWATYHPTRHCSFQSLTVASSLSQCLYSALTRPMGQYSRRSFTTSTLLAGSLISIPPGSQVGGGGMGVPMECLREVAFPTSDHK